MQHEPADSLGGGPVAEFGEGHQQRAVGRQREPVTCTERSEVAEPDGGSRAQGHAGCEAPVRLVGADVDGDLTAYAVPLADAADHDLDRVAVLVGRAVSPVELETTMSLLLGEMSSKC